MQQLKEKVIPALRSILRESNPEMYAKWQGNCCRQCALVTAWWLTTQMSEYDHYEWQMWEGLFYGRWSGAMITFDHSWVFGHNPNFGYVLDLSVPDDQIDIPVSENVRPWGNSRRVSNVTQIFCVRTDWQAEMNQREIFTQLTGHELVRRVQIRVHEATIETTV